MQDDVVTQIQETLHTLVVKQKLNLNVKVDVDNFYHQLTKFAKTFNVATRIKSGNRLSKVQDVVKTILGDRAVCEEVVAILTDYNDTALEQDIALLETPPLSIDSISSISYLKARIEHIENYLSSL